MCGIVGCLERRHGTMPLLEIARSMADAISHRGRDDSGVWSNSDDGIALGHRRLSIVDLSPAGHQPMPSADGRRVMVFNGEIYNHAALRAELERAGLAPAWRGHSDTEVLLAAVGAWGLDNALQRLVGMFAFAIWDCVEKTLSLARDRIGEKPIYYGFVDDGFVFASELAALKKHPRWVDDIDRNALGLFLRHNYIPAPHSIYKDIRKLLPGSYLLLRAGSSGIDVRTYWRASDAAQRGAMHPFRGSGDEAANIVEELLMQSLSGQMQADVPLGAFLSGGVDSSAVVALMQLQSSRPVKTFSIGFENKDYDEAPHAKAVACHLGTDHTELYCTTADALGVVPRLAQVYSEPFADSSQIPTLLVSELARRHVAVSLSGDGGDELFGGYTRYSFASRLWPVLAKLPVRLRRSAAQAIKNISPATWDAIAKRPLSLAFSDAKDRYVGDKLHKGLGALTANNFDDFYRELVSHWPDPAAVVLGLTEQPSIFADKGAQITDSLMQRMMFLDQVSYLTDDILVKVDRAAMSVGLETRVPMLDHRLIEFAMSLPAGLLFQKNNTKWPLRQVVYRHVPTRLIERPKLGFAIPLADWLRTPLRDWAESLLDERRLAKEGFFSPKPIREAWNDHLSGRRNFHFRLWNVLMFQAWNEGRA